MNASRYLKRGTALWKGERIVAKKARPHAKGSDGSERLTSEEARKGIRQSFLRGIRMAGPTRPKKPGKQQKKLGILRFKKKSGEKERCPYNRLRRESPAATRYPPDERCSCAVSNAGVDTREGGEECTVSSKGMERGNPQSTMSHQKEKKKKSPRPPQKTHGLEETF